jgi:hypothetical protein
MMAKLIYFMPMSLDGYIADDGNFDWSTPSEEAFAFVTDLHRPIGTYLYGRKEYETMAVWQTPEVIPGFTPAMLEFARILASGRQDRLLQIAGDRLYTEDASGAGIPPAGGSRVNGSIASRYFGGWSDPRRPRDPDRARRRVSSARRAYFAWRRHSGAAQQRTHQAGTAGRAPFC